jgi:polyisoprenoid-binding protein YceI
MTVFALDVARLSFWLGVSLLASLAALAAAVACGFGTASINRSKGRSPRAGFWFGFCFPLVAIAVAALLPHRAAPSGHAGDVPSRRVLARIAVGVGAASLLVPVGAIVVYTQFINDPEPRLDTNDLADLVGADSATTSSAGATFLNAALLTSSADAEASDDTTATSDETASGETSAECAVESATTDTSEADETAATTESAETTEPAASDSDGAEGFDGEWAVTSESEFGYRVPEVLAGVETEAVGRGNEIAGSFTVSGSEIAEACFVVQVASITSDESMRDGQFNGRIMETGTYPTATFVLTEPIVLDELPEVGGDAVTATATGELTLHGVTQTVTFDVTVQAGDDVVGVLGEIPIVFSDYGIDDPSGGPAEVGDEGTLEFLLAFEPV